MLHAGFDLSRKKLDICLLSERGEHLDQLVVPPDVDSLRRLARRIDEVHAEPVSAVIESMTGARLVHDTLEAEGWAVEIADAQKVKGLAPLGLQDRRDRLPRSSRRCQPARPCAGDLASRPDGSERSASSPAFASTWSSTRLDAQDTASTRPSSTSGAPCPVTDLFGVEGRQLLERLEVPEPWRGNIGASVLLIDELERQIA